jgi:hypothetical protein
MEAQPTSAHPLGPELTRADRSADAEPTVPAHLLSDLGETEFDVVNENFALAGRIFGEYRDAGIPEEELVSVIAAAFVKAEKYPAKGIDIEDWLARAARRDLEKTVETTRHHEVAAGIDIAEYWKTVETVRAGRPVRGWMQARVGDYNRSRNIRDLSRLSKDVLKGLWYELDGRIEPTEFVRGLPAKTRQVLAKPPYRFTELYERHVLHCAAVSFNLARNGELMLDLDRMPKVQQVAFLERTAVSAAQEFLGKRAATQAKHREASQRYYKTKKTAS